ncbi:MAG: transporter [Lysobacterales bacterium]|jgi:HAE1 family hydrophobic/amphiphilic exporter-1|nr:MAG: transporter [Xanthomonadales bacterium]
MNPASLAVRRPVATAMAYVSLLVVGMIAAFRLPLEYFPAIAAPFLFIQVPYPGATPEEVEQRITRPIEEAIASLRGVEEIRSQSTSEGANVFVLFRFGEDIAVRAVEARDRLDAVRGELPEDVRRINIFRWNSGDAPILNVRISGQRDLDGAYELLERELKRPLERIPGVARVELQGVEPREVLIEVIPERLAAHGIALNALAERLAQANFAVAGGMIEDGHRRLAVQPRGELRSLQALRDLPLDARGLRLSDIAEVRIAPRRRDYERRLEGRYAVGVEVYKQSDANVVEVGRRALAEVERIGASPSFAGIELIVFDDQATGITSSLADLTSAGLVGLVLAVGVLFLFLGHWAPTLMVALSIPVCLTVALAAFYFLGMSLNVLTLMGLLLAIGLLVDNAVVVSENIARLRERWPHRPEQAALAGTEGVALALSAGTLTSVIVFAPNIFGEKNFITVYLAQVATAIGVTLLASWVVAVTLIPMLAARIHAPASGYGRSFSALGERYSRWLEAILRRRKTSFLALSGIVLLSLLVPVRSTKVDLFPPEQQEVLRLNLTLNANYQLDELRESIERIERFLDRNRERFGIDQIYSYFNEQGMAFTQFRVRPEQRWRSQAIMDEIRRELPPVPVGIVGFRQGFVGAREGLRVVISGPDSARLPDVEQVLASLLAEIPGVARVRRDSSGAPRELTVRVDRERALRYGFSAEEVARYLGIALRGIPLREYRGEEGELPVWLRFRDSERIDRDRLAGLSLRNRRGEDVPLLAVVAIEREQARPSISRVNRESAVTLELELEAEARASQVRQAIEAALRGVALPEGFRWSLGGAFMQSDEAGKRMLFNTLVAIALVYIVMAALFESLAHPLVIASSIVFAIFGVYWFFWITGTTFSLMAWIGVLILIGVVVNNGIVLVEHVNALRRQGLGRREALIQGARERLRPILMTVATTVLGMLPLAFGQAQIGGEGPPYFPMARAIIGGLLFSTLITLLLMPLLYEWIDDRALASRRFWARLWHGAAQPGGSPEAASRRGGSG